MRLAWLLVFATVLSGCPKAVPRPEVRVEARQALDALDRQDAQRGPVQGDGKLTVQAPTAHGLVSVFVAAQQPGQAHLELMDFFGKPQAIFVTDGQRFGLYQAQENRYLQGAATPASIARLIPVPLSSEELAAVLLGAWPRLRTATGEVAEPRWAGEPGDPHLELTDGTSTQKLWLTPAGELARVELSGARTLKVGFADFQTVQKVAFPRRIHVEAPDAQATLELKLTEVTYGAPVDAGLFHPEAPEDVPVENVQGPSASVNWRLAASSIQLQ